MSSASDISFSLSACAGDSSEPDASAPDVACLLASTPGVVPVDDAAFAAAYEATGDVDRARLKTCIARLHVLYGQAGLWGTVGPGAGDVREGRTATRWRQGFTSLDHVSPCAWTLLCVDASWASGPRLLAALLPALFAGVGSVAVLRVAGGGAWPPQVLAALELAGQEVAADAEPAAVSALLKALSASGGAGGAAGRLLLLGEHSDQISALARAQGVPVWRDAPSPTIGIVLCGDGIDKSDCPDGAALRAAHPDATFVDVPALPGPTGCTGAPAPLVPLSPLSPLTPLSAVACAPAHAGGWLAHAGLVLGPGHEWCWMHPDLTPAWFTRRSVALLPASSPPDGLPGLP